jgi:hypothetical protein
MTSKTPGIQISPLGRQRVIFVLVKLEDLKNNVFDFHTDVIHERAF